MKTYAVRERVNSTLAEHLLFHRGVRSPEERERFLNPNYEKHTHDPFLMKDMEKAVTRILTAVEKGERIAIFSDYDADGIPGAVVLHDFLKKIGYANFENYIPDRHAEGFGLNTAAVTALAGRGAKLLITIDCGITDTEEVARANEFGMEVIITDHHLLGEKVPPAYAILNPKQPDCAYPEKMLCGSGVAFKLVQALCSRLHSFLEIGNCLPTGDPPKGEKLKIPATTFPIGWEKWLLDMVGIATLSDMVPLTGENRVFAYYGLKVLRKSPRIGLGQLLSELRLNRSALNEDDVGFSITPRINAASRMGVPLDAFRLFATDDTVEAGILAAHLNKINDERKGKVAALVREVRRIVAERHLSSAPKVIVAGNPSWRPALLGLVANALAEDYQKPVFLWGREGNEVLKGSCRTGNGMSVSTLMQEARTVFDDYGGHADAGGFSVALGKVGVLEAELERAYERALASARAEEPVCIDATLSLDEVNDTTWRQIEQLAPFGVGNPKPLFLFSHAVVKKIEPFGKGRQHLKLIFAKSNGVFVNAIKFYAKPEDFTTGSTFSPIHGRTLSEGQSVNLLAHLERSVFRDTPELRLRIVDVL